MSALLFLIFFVLILTALWFLSHIIFFSLLPMIRGAFYAETTPDILEDMMALLRVRQGEKAVDLGSGDGRIVIALAKAGAQAHGYEINPVLVWRSRRAICQKGLEGKALIRHKSFWRENVSSFDIVTVYGIGYIMKELEEKLQGELRAGARVVSNGFSFPNWRCTRQKGRAFLYVA